MADNPDSDGSFDSLHFLDIQEEEDVLTICLIVNKKFENPKIIIIFARLLTEVRLFLS